MRRPFDAVLLIAFGGPQGTADIRPFLANVLRGRRVPPARIDEVAHHYERFGGVSPITELTRRQAAGIASRLAARGIDVPVCVGMRNWHPFLIDTMRDMAADGVRQALGIIASAYRSASSCEQYKQNVADAQWALAREGVRSPRVWYVGDWNERPGFVLANAAHVRGALAALPDVGRERARLITAHSIPATMARDSRYESQLRATAALVAGSVGLGDWTLAYQSRSGRPEDPWLGPDVLDALREAHAAGVPSVVIAPIGFICDHIEVLYDLDEEAATLSRQLRLPMARAATVNDHPVFLDMLADLVEEAMALYSTGHPLPLVQR